MGRRRCGGGTQVSETPAAVVVASATAELCFPWNSIGLQRAPYSCLEAYEIQLASRNATGVICNCKQTIVVHKHLCR